MFLGIMSMVAFSLVDTWFVGQLGARELAAMTFTFPVIMVISGLSFGLGVGATTVISRAVGQGDRYRVQRLTTDSLTLAVTVVMILVVVGMLGMEPVFRAMGAEPETLPLIMEYMRIWMPGTVFVVVPMVGNSAIRASGDARTPALIMLVAVVANAILDPLLIFGLGPFPRMGLAGAALSTVLARAVTMVVSLSILNFKYQMLTFRYPSIREGLASWNSILYVGLPNAATNLVLPIGAGLVTRIVAGHGEPAVAAFGVASRIEMFAMAPAMAMGSALGPFVGQNWGAGAHDRVRRGIGFTLRASQLWGTGIMIPLALLADPVSRLFNPHPEVQEYLALYMSLVPLTYGLRSVVNQSKVAMNSLNRPLPSSFITLTQMFLLNVPLCLLGSFLFGMAGIYLASNLTNLISWLWARGWLTRILGQELAGRPRSVISPEPAAEIPG